MTKSIFNIYSAANKATRSLSFLLIAVMSLTNSTLWALPEPIVSNILMNSNIKTNAVLRVTDQKYVSEKPSILATKSVDNTIVFEINEAAKVRLPKNFIYTINLIIASKDVNNKPFPNMEATMVLNFDSTSSRTALRQVLNLKGRHDLTITVKSTSYTSSTIPNVTFTNNTAPTVVPLAFNLYASILVDRVMTFNCTTKLTGVTSQGVTFISNGKVERRELLWRKVINADEYDVEWTFYDAQSEVLRTLLGASYKDFDFLFKNNATRITTTNLRYNITLIYPAGRIFYRIRAVHYDVKGQREVTPWTSSGFSSALPLFTFAHQFTVVGHDMDWNWQTQQVFAEEGKQTQSLKYFDASLRERQTQALSNAAKTVVVGETIYDHQGRPVLKVMPAPMPNASMGYVNGLSKNTNATVLDYSKSDFINATNDCLDDVKGMNPDQSKGAANYFSPSNPLKSIAENQFTPDAEKYPFSITEFMPDATGRIRRQSGVGKDFKLGSGHETQYFYAKPSQEELDRLFGLDVGPDSSYLKNMVIDGNGQASVSYIDAHGRTIATALAGETTTNLDGLTTLPSGAETIKKNLLNNVVQGESLVSSYTLPIHTEGPHTIAYLINKSNLRFDNSCPTPTLTASYFDNISLSGTPLSIRNETSINNEWGSGGPAVVGLSTNLFSIRYEGTIISPVAGLHTFTATADDGVRLWVNGVLLIDKWFNQGPTAYSATYNFDAHTAYTIKMEYYENYGGATAKLWWTIPGQASQPITFSHNVCTTCAYDLDIAITSDECSFTPLYFKTPIKLENCNAPLTALPDLIKQWEGMTLKKGTYQITKRLTVNRSELEKNWETFKAEADCIPTRATFIKTAVDALTYEECKGTPTDDCTICKTLTFGAFYPDYYIRCPKTDNQTDAVYNAQVSQAYKETMNRCRLNCSDECSILFQNLLFDVSPNGQYGVSYVNGVYTAKPKATIYSSSNILETYKNPNIVYLTEEGKPDFVMIDGVATIPNKLTLAQFVENWQPSWAQVLYEKHPEFCYFEWCSNNPTFFDLDDNLLHRTDYTTFTNMSIDELKNLGAPTNINDPLWNFLTPAQRLKLNTVTTLDNKTYSLFDLATFMTYKCNTIRPASECVPLPIRGPQNGDPSVSSVIEKEKQQNGSLLLNEQANGIEVLNNPVNQGQNDTTPVNRLKNGLALSEAINAASDGIIKCPCVSVKTGCAAKDSLFWITLRTLYLTNRRQMLYEYRETKVDVACKTAIAGIVAPKIRRVFLAKDIPAAPPLPVDPAAEKQKVVTKMIADYTPVWEGIARTWLDKLKCLNPTTAQKGYMFNAFMTLLMRTATYQDASLGQYHEFDNYRPNGASSLANNDPTPIKLVINAAGQTRDVRSVEGIIRELFGNIDKCKGCDVSLIQTPGLYDYQYNAATLIDAAPAANTDVCNRFAALRTQYDADMAKHGFTSFFDFFNSMSVVRVSRGEFDIIQNNCANAYPMNTCETLGNTIALPPQLEDRCKTCEQLAALVTTYNNTVCTLYNGPISIEVGVGVGGAAAPPRVPAPVNPMTLELATAQMNRLANWLNYQTGMNLSPNEYAWFFNQCRNQTGKTSLFSVAASQLNMLASAYTAAQKVEVKRPPYMICPRPLTLAEEFIDSSCYYAVKAQAINNANIRYDAFIEATKNDFFNRYSRNCLEKARLNEVFTDLGPSKEYHYTLYYYDQAGNLVQTVPPAGVKPLTPAEVANVQAARKGLVVNPSGLVANYPFTDNLNDYSGSGLNLTASADASGIVDGSLKMMGYDTYTSVITNILNTDNHTISFYAKFPTNNNEGWRKIFGYNAGGSDRSPGIWMYPSSVPKLHWRYDPYNTGLTGTSEARVFNTNEWVHVTGVKNLNTLSYYINGVNVANDGVYPTKTAGAAALTFGTYYGSSTALFLKDFKIFNRSLTNEEVAGLPIKLKPDHALKTQYWYNSLNQVTMQTSPDGGTSLFWYDFLGRLTLSQNEKQFSEAKAGQTSNYSYTLFDNLGRTTEVGQGAWKNTALPFSGTTSDREVYYNNVDDYVKQTTGIVLAASINDASAFVKEQITRTHYDTPPQYVGTVPNFSPKNLRNRVAVVSYANNYANANSFDFATHYSYDVAGNVKNLVHNIPELAAEKYAIPIIAVGVSLGVGVITPYTDPNTPSDIALTEAANLGPILPVERLDNRTHRYKRLEYDYDLVSGKVNRLYYQSGEPDQFIYRYDYDEDNRLKKAYSATDGLNWSLEAEYKYYKHGPLSRIELGRDHKKVQGMDYAYTLQGWIKGVNASFLDPNKDIGKDGVANTANANIGKDVFGYTIGYFDGDYKPIGTTATKDVGFDAQTTGTAAASTYARKGLFNGNIRHIASWNEKFTDPLLMTYGYDQLNRINKMESWNAADLNKTTRAWTLNTAQTKWREDVTYDPNGNIKTYLRRDETGFLMDNLVYNYNETGGRLTNNQLTSVTEQTTTQTPYPDDIEAGNNSFVYDKIGNLVTDNKENTTFAWSVYGKMLSANKAGITTAFGYDPQQNRFKKSTPTTSDFYIRDAQGNVLAIYQKKDNNFTWKEQHLYGSSRLGIWKAETRIQGTYTLNVAAMQQSVREYELTNHLGNVLSTITDKGVITSAQDYYPFGLTLASRSFTEGGSSYRYSFNGKEDDKGLKQQDYGMRIYRMDLGRFLSVDPLGGKFPWYTPYQFAGNIPTSFIDLDGLEEVSPSISYNPMLQMGAANYPVLKPSQWKVSDTECACETFASAARFNTNSLNNTVYLPVRQIHKYYVWAGKEIDKLNANIKFFHAAAEVTSLFGVGGAYVAPEWWTGLSDHGRKSLADVNERLLAENISVVKEVLSTGKSSLFPEVKGSILWDFEYVNREQTFLTKVITADPLSKSDQNAINKNFANYEPLHLEYTLAKALLGVKSLNYEPQVQRMAIGRSLVFMLHLEKKGFEGSDDYNQAIKYLKTTYGEANTNKFLNVLKDEKIKKERIGK